MNESKPQKKSIPVVVVGEKHLGQDKIARNRTEFPAALSLRKPSWIRVRIPPGNAVSKLKLKLRENALVTVCEEASCPNIHECFSKGTATFMILGEVCTRRCSFCDVAHGRPKPPDVHEPTNLARTIRERMPWMRMHASTQLAVHNEDGAVFAADMGFKRVVLARELTARDISRIKEAVGDRIELEVFCHGSLCYSYSGLCFFSGAEDARSGNRGECAYTCRKPYRIVSEPGYGFLFSMKDLATSDHVDALLGAGVSALKIEGRKKDAQYVASSVGLYKQARDRALGEASGAARNFSEDLKSSYQRDTTSFFVKGRYHENVIDLDNAGHRGTRIGVVQRLRVVLDFPLHSARLPDHELRRLSHRWDSC